MKENIYNLDKGMKLNTFSNPSNSKTEINKYFNRNN